MTRWSKPDPKPVEICFAELVRETDKAWMFKTDDGDAVWLPKSQCELDEDELLVQVPEWLAIEKGLV